MAPRKKGSAGLVHMVVDLEAVTDPDFRDQEKDRAGKTKFPPPPAWQIICAGYAILEDYRVQSWGVLDESEEETVGKLVQAVETIRPTLVTFNGRGYDVPVIAARAMRWGIAWPWLYRTKAPRYRYDPSAHLDLMDYLADHNATRPSTLDVWARICGWPGKGAVSGSDVALLHASGQRAEIASYCLGDIAQTCAVFLRTELLRGELGVVDYREAASALLDHTEADERTAALAFAVDRARFLCDPAMSDRAAAE